MSIGFRVTPQHWPKHLRSHVHSLQGNLPLSHYTWDHTSTVSRITASQTLYMRSHVFGSQGDPSQTLYLGSHVHSFYCDHPPRHCTWAYTLTVSIMMPFPRPCTWVLCTHIHILQGDSLPRPCTWVLTTMAQGKPLPDSGPGVTCLQSPG